jgi:hypothetical protein
VAQVLHHRQRRQRLCSAQQRLADVLPDGIERRKARRLELEVLVVQRKGHQGRRVRQALHHGVEEAGVAQVAQAGANLRSRE